LSRPVLHGKCTKRFPSLFFENVRKIKIDSSLKKCLGRILNRFTMQLLQQMKLLLTNTLYYFAKTQAAKAKIGRRFTDSPACTRRYLGMRTM